jgi:hypothetical protein
MVFLYAQVNSRQQGSAVLVSSTKGIRKYPEINKSSAVLQKEF